MHILELKGSDELNIEVTIHNCDERLDRLIIQMDQLRNILFEVTVEQGTIRGIALLNPLIAGVQRRPRRVLDSRREVIKRP